MQVSLHECKFTSNLHYPSASFKKLASNLHQTCTKLALPQCKFVVNLHQTCTTPVQVWGKLAPNLHQTCTRVVQMMNKKQNPGTCTLFFQKNKRKNTKKQYYMSWGGLISRKNTGSNVKSNTALQNKKRVDTSTKTSQVKTLRSTLR